MKIYHFQDYETRLERTQKIIRARKDKRKFLQALLISAIVTPLVLGIMYHLTVHAYADTPLEEATVTVEGLEPVNSTNTSSQEIKSAVEDCTGSCIEAKILEYFPRNGKTMVAIAKAESGLTMDAVGYNCYYVGEVVHKVRVKGAISKACKKQHRIHSWSIDCFVLQKNYIGRKECPEGVTVDEHLKEVADLSRKQGLQAWSSYNAGMHKQHLD